MKQPQRTFLVVMDETMEMNVALRYAAWRARHNKGQVALLCVIEPREIQPWKAVEQTLAEDAVKRARAQLTEHEKLIETISGSKPIMFIRQGNRQLTLLQLIEQQPTISVLVLSANTGPGGPGPLVTYLTSGKGIRELKIPLIIVPDTYKLEGDNLLV